MTAKEALRNCVNGLTEEEAAHWLTLMHVGAGSATSTARADKPPTWRELLLMTPKERDEALKRWPGDTDVSEFDEWDVTAADGLDDIDE